MRENQLYELRENLRKRFDRNPDSLEVHELRQLLELECYEPAWREIAEEAIRRLERREQSDFEHWQGQD